MKKILTVYTDGLEDSFLERIKEAGFEGVDLGCYGDIVDENKWEAVCERVQEKLAAHGLTVGQIHMPYYDLVTDSSENFREEKEREIFTSLKVMARLGVKWGVFHPLSSTNFDYDIKRAMKDNREKLLNYLEIAEKLQVGIAVENIPIFPDCPQYRFFPSNPDDHYELIHSIDSQYLGVCWDFGHFNLMPYDKTAVLEKMADDIKVVHMHNNFEDRDSHYCPALGTLQWDRLMPILKKHRFSGDFCLEVNLKLVHPQMKFDYIDFCGRTAQWLKELYEKG